MTPGILFIVAMTVFLAWTLSMFCATIRETVANQAQRTAKHDGGTEAHAVRAHNDVMQQNAWAFSAADAWSRITAACGGSIGGCVGRFFNPITGRAGSSDLKVEDSLSDADAD